MTKVQAPAAHRQSADVCVCVFAFFQQTQSSTPDLKSPVFTPFRVFEQSETQTSSLSLSLSLSLPLSLSSPLYPSERTRFIKLASSHIIPSPTTTHVLYLEEYM